MPSIEQAASADKSSISQSEGYSKILAIIHNADFDEPTSPSTSIRNGRIAMSLTTHSKFNQFLSNLPNGDLYGLVAGGDISNILIPFYGATDYNGLYPSFSQDADMNSQAQSGVITLVDLLPFQWEDNVNYLYDRYASPSGDSLSYMVSGEDYPGNVDRFRDVSETRGIAFRLPMLAGGWGYTKDNVAIPSGTTSSKFAGETTKGWNVDPLQYIVAPVDFRYDIQRNVWTTANIRQLEGKIISAPNGQTEFTDNRYWVQVVKHFQAVDAVFTDRWNPIADQSDEWQNFNPVVTNIAEQRDGTHSLTIGDYVIFFEVTNISRDPNATPITYYIMAQGGGELGSPQYPYQIFQGGVNNRAVWDFLRAGPPIGN